MLSRMTPTYDNPGTLSPFRCVGCNSGRYTKLQPFGVRTRYVTVACSDCNLMQRVVDSSKIPDFSDLEQWPSEEMTELLRTQLGTPIEMRENGLTEAIVEEIDRRLDDWEHYRLFDSGLADEDPPRWTHGNRVTTGNG